MALPVAVWFYLSEALWKAVPLTAIIATGGLMAVVSVRRGQPSRVFYSTAATVFAAIFYGQIWIVPLIDQYKSPRSFALEVNRRCL